MLNQAVKRVMWQLLWNKRSMQTNPIKRRTDLDWLRVSAICVVFIYHTTRFFNLGDWHVKNATTYTGVEIWNIFASRWMMPLFFIISGASLFYALEKKRGFLSFAKQKALRLIVPVVIAVFSHSILQIYIERITHNQFSGSFIEFLPHYFDGVYLHIGGKGNFAFHGMHLWYLLFLFIYTMLFYPLFIWFKNQGKSIPETIGRITAVPGIMYILLPLPLLIIKFTVPEPVLEAGSGGWAFLYYIWFLIAGFIIVSSTKLEKAIKKQRWISFALGVIFTVIYSILRFGSAYESMGMSGKKLNGMIYSFFGSWALILAILGFGMKHLNSDKPVLTYANEGVISFYILHQPVIVCVGYFIVQLSIPDIVKWIIITTISFTLIRLLYEYCIRRFNIIRFLFGMKPQQSRESSIAGH